MLVLVLVLAVASACADPSPSPWPSGVVLLVAVRPAVDLAIVSNVF